MGKLAGIPSELELLPWWGTHTPPRQPSHSAPRNTTRYQRIGKQTTSATPRVLPRNGSGLESNSTLQVTCPCQSGHPASLSCCQTQPPHGYQPCTTGANLVEDGGSLRSQWLSLVQKTTGCSACGEHAELKEGSVVNATFGSVPTFWASTQSRPTTRNHKRHHQPTTHSVEQLSR